MKTTATAIRPAPSTRRTSVPTPLRSRRPHPSDEVRDLLEAAGPLDVEDIAGGLDWPLGEARTCVSSLVSDGHLRQDEWDRFGLAGDWS